MRSTTPPLLMLRRVGRVSVLRRVSSRVRSLMPRHLHLMARNWKASASRRCAPTCHPLRDEEAIVSEVSFIREATFTALFNIHHVGGGRCKSLESGRWRRSTVEQVRLKLARRASPNCGVTPFRSISPSTKEPYLGREADARGYVRRARLMTLHNDDDLLVSTPASHLMVVRYGYTASLYCYFPPKTPTCRNLHILHTVSTTSIPHAHPP